MNGGRRNFSVFAVLKQVMTIEILTEERDAQKREPLRRLTNTEERGAQKRERPTERKEAQKRESTTTSKKPRTVRAQKSDSFRIVPLCSAPALQASRLVTIVSQLLAHVHCKLFN